MASAALPGAGAIKPMPTSPPGTPFSSSRLEPKPLVDVRPPLVKLPADVLGAGLHYRLGHQMTQLRLVPVFAQGVNVGNGEKALGGVRQ